MKIRNPQQILAVLVDVPAKQEKYFNLQGAEKEYGSTEWIKWNSANKTAFFEVIFEDLSRFQQIDHVLKTGWDQGYLHLQDLYIYIELLQFFLSILLILQLV